MKTSFSRFFTVTLLLGCLFLLQLHGIFFWKKTVGWSGVVWSLLLDVMLVWLWIRPGLFEKLLGLIVCGLTLSGPFYEVGEPLLREINEVLEYEAMALKKYEADKLLNVQKEEALENEIELLQASLLVYQQNSKQRAGWLPAIEAVRDEIKLAREELNKVQSKSELAPSLNAGIFDVFANSLVVLMQLASLVLFQIVAVLCLVSLRPNRYQQELTTGTDTSKLEPKPSLSSVEQLAQQLEDYLSAKGLTQKAFADLFGFSPRDVSLLRNHKKRLANGQRTASAQFIDEVRRVLMPVGEEL